MEVETQTYLSFDINSKPPFSYSVDVNSDHIELVSDTSGATEAPEMNDFGSSTRGGDKCEPSEMASVFAPDADSPVAGDGCTAGELKSSHSSAAMKLQKFYRGYRTRRLLADSAVVAEELWWQAIDYARLNHSTISFFNFLKPETAASRWNRITLNASKVGKGLSKDAKAQKLAFQHWIEAIDPRHRYGHSLHFYYEEWCKADAGQPFFYWLDLGDGREVDLEKCSRAKLRQQCIKYLGPQEREHYEYIVVGGKILHKQTGSLLDIGNRVPREKWIFVMSTCKRLYAGEKKKGVFHHSSFLAGGATLAAGRLVVENGTLKSISAYSGHYRPTDDRLDSLLSFLKENGVNLDEVEIRKANEDNENYEDINSNRGVTTAEVSTISDSSQPSIPNEEEKDLLPEAIGGPQTETKINYRRTLSGGLQSPRAEVPKTAILQRINSKKAARSYQLGNQLSLKWSTGAGPRIGCIADYPAELRLQALEFTNLSPRTSPTSSSASRRIGGGLPSSPMASPSTYSYNGDSRRIGGLASPSPMASPSTDTYNGDLTSSGI